MAEQPNLVAGDAEGNPLEDQDHLVNGRVPGKGSGLFTENAEGAVTPVDGKPFSTGEIGNGGSPVNFTDPLSVGKVNRTIYASHYGTDGAAIASALAETDGTQWDRIVVDPISSAPYTVGVAAPLEIPSKTVVEIREDVKLADSTPENIFQNANFEDDATDDSDIVIAGKGGTLNGNKANQSTNSKTSHASGFYQCCVSFLGANKTRIQNLHTVDPYMHGVSLGGCSDVAVIGGDYQNSRLSGVHAHFRESDSTINSDVSIQSPRVIGGTEGNAVSAGVYVSGFGDVTVSDPHIRGCTNHGIMVFNGDAALGGIDGSVTGGSITDVGGHGVRVRTTNDTTGTGTHHIRLSNILFSGIGSDGVRLSTANDPINNVAIDGNTFRSITGSYIGLNESASISYTADNNDPEPSSGQGVSARLSGDTSISSGTATQIPYDGVSRDDRNELDTTTGDFVVEYPGRYRVTATVALDSIGDGNKTNMYILKNGSIRHVTNQYGSVSSQVAELEATAIVECTAGDVITAEAFQDTGGSQTMKGAQDYRTRLFVDQVAIEK